MSDRSRRSIIRSLLASLLPLSLVGQNAKSSDHPTAPPHEHKWSVGPLYVTAAVSYEEPGFYPPSGLIKFEFCKVCGIMRVPLDLLTLAGKNNIQ